MAQTYSKYSVNFLEKSADQGLRYTFYRLFSVIPSSIGHVLDTLLGLDGLFFEKDSHFSGPFGFLLGIVPLLVGLVVGQILQIILNVPSYLGYYLFDFPLRLLFRDFHKSMLEYHPLLSLLLSVLIKYTEATPTQMQGMFGFTLGLLPHIARHLVNRISATICSIIDFTIDNICDGIRFVYSSIYQALFELSFDEMSEKLNQSEASAELPADDSPKPPPKVSRIRRPVDNKPIDEVAEGTLLKVFENKIDLFHELGITLADYEANAEIVRTRYKKLTVTCHPDKVTDSNQKAAAEAKWELINAAKEILQDPNSAMSKKYLRLCKTGQITLLAADIASPAPQVSAAAPTSTGAATGQSQSSPVSVGANPNSFLPPPSTGTQAATASGRRIKRPIREEGTSNQSQTFQH